MVAMEEFACELDGGACRCVVSDVFELLGRKYAMEVVCVVASHGTVRFGTVEAHLPEASTSTLSTRLDELEAAGLLARERYDEIPPRVEYELTDAGHELAARLRPLAEWAAGRGPDEDATAERSDGRGDGRGGRGPPQ